jgi:hypothetical protein
VNFDPKWVCSAHFLFTPRGEHSQLFRKPEVRFSQKIFTNFNPKFCTLRIIFLEGRFFFLTKNWSCIFRVAKNMNAQTNDDQLEFRSGWPNWANFRMFGRLFSLGCFFEHYIQNEPKLLGCLFHGKSYALILTKMFFFPTSSSCHPGSGNEF